MGEVTLGEKLKALAVGTTLPDDQRLQVLIHLCAELAARISSLESKVDRIQWPKKYA